MNAKELLGKHFYAIFICSQDLGMEIIKVKSEIHPKKRWHLIELEAREISEKLVALNEIAGNRVL